MAVDEEKFRRYEQSSPFMSLNHIVICEISLTGAVMKVDITNDSRNRLGFVHGGLLFSMLDDACGLAARADSRRYVTQNANVNFLSNVREGTIYARSNVIKRGHRIVTVHGEVVTADGALLADSEMDFYCIDDDQTPDLM